MEPSSFVESSCTSEDPPVGLPFTFAYIYDWYDGPTAGIAIDANGQPVAFHETDRTYGSVFSRSFLLTPITRSEYDAVVDQYGPTPYHPSEGANMEPELVTDQMVSMFQRTANATEGTLVTCRYSQSWEFLEERVLNPEELSEVLERISFFWQDSDSTGQG